MIAQPANSEMGSNNAQTTLISDSASSCIFALGEIFGRSKSKQAFESQCSTEKIIQFFKCSRRSCDFTCDDKESFYCHLLTHNEDEEQDVCVYCERMFVIENLAVHMEAQHGNRRFQCKMCFYRGCTRAHLIVHCVKQHNLKFVTGIACPRMPGALMPDVKARARTLLYRCSLCKFRSFRRDVFERHLSATHPETMAADRFLENGLRPGADEGSPRSSRLHCVYCQQQVTPDLRLYSGAELIRHLDEEHGLANCLTCLYCGEALQSEDALSHMTELHSDWPINILDRSAQCSVRNWNGASSQGQIATSAAETNTAPKKYSAAPRSVQEKRQRKLINGTTATMATTGTAATSTTLTGNGGLMSSVSGEPTSRFSMNSSGTAESPREKVPSKPRSILKKKASSSLANTNATSTVADLPPKPPRVLRCASCLCTDPGATVDYMNQEALALHMRDKHNVYYICQRCFHGEEKFCRIKAHIAQCEGSTELDIVTLKNGVLKTSSKVRSMQKERQQHAAAAAAAASAAASSGGTHGNRVISSQAENRAIAQAQSATVGGAAGAAAAAGRDPMNRAGSSRDTYVLLNDIPRGPLVQSENAANKSNASSGSSSSGSKISKTHRAYLGHSTKIEATSGDADGSTMSGMKSLNSGIGNSSRKRDRVTPSWTTNDGRLDETAIGTVIVNYQGERLPIWKFEQLTRRIFPLVRRLTPAELETWGVI